MYAAHSEAPAGNRDSHLPLQAAPANSFTAPIDTDRLVWDQEYRDEVRAHLNSAAR